MAAATMHPQRLATALTATCQHPVHYAFSSVVHRPHRRASGCVARAAGAVLDRIEEVQATNIELLPPSTQLDINKEFAEYKRATQQLKELQDLSAELLSSVADAESLLQAPQVIYPASQDVEAAEKRRAKRQQSRAARKKTTATSSSPAAVAIPSAQAQPALSSTALQPTASRSALSGSKTSVQLPSTLSTSATQTSRRSKPSKTAVAAMQTATVPIQNQLAQGNSSSLATVPQLQQASGLSLPIPVSSTAQEKSKARASRNASLRRSVAPSAVTANAKAAAPSDSTGQYLKRAGSVALMTPEQQKETALLVKEFLGLKSVERELVKVLKRKPTIDEFGKAVNVDPMQLHMRLKLGQEAKTHMVKANFRLVISVVKKYQGRGLGLQDLITEGMHGLLRGVEKFEADKGFRFSTYAHWWIRQAVSRAVQEQSRAVRLPHHMQELLYKVKQTQLQLQQKYGRSATWEEVSEVTGIPVDKITEVLATANQSTSLETSTVDDDGGTELKDMIADERDTPDEAFEDEMLVKGMDEVLLTGLSAREAEVLRMHWGLSGRREMTLEEIGEHFNITRERVRQLEARALQRLKNQQEKLKGVLNELQDTPTVENSTTSRSSRGTKKT